MTFSRLRRIWRHRARSVFRRDAADRELARELAFHFDQLVGEHVADGMSLQDARLAARRAMGSTALIEDECRDQRRVGWLHDLVQDVLYGARILRTNLAFTIVAAGSLAVAIGANGAMASAIDAAFIRTLPFRDAERLVVVRTSPRENPRQTSNAAFAEFLGWKTAARTVETLGASIADQRDFAPDGPSGAERVDGQLVSQDVFPTLAVAPLIGRVFEDRDFSGDDAADVLVLSYALWQRRYNGDPGILSRPIRTNGRATSIIGVMPREFRYPIERVGYWTPLRVTQARLEGPARFYVVVARLKSGVTEEETESELNVLLARDARSAPDRGRVVRLQPLRDVLFGWTKAPILTLQAAVSLLLIVACINVAGLLMARATSRQPEIAVRAALGASRPRIVRQLLAESVLVSFVGGGAGIVVAWAGVQGLSWLAPPPGGTRLGSLALDLRSVGAMAVMSATAGIAVGLIPALAAHDIESSVTFRSGAVRAGGVRPHRTRGALVAAQLALALVLAIGAGLFVKSFIRLAGRDLNFEPYGVLTFQVRIPPQDIGTERNTSPAARFERIYDRLSDIEGAESVAGISFPPINSLIVPVVTLASQDGPLAAAARASRRATYFVVTPRFFSTMKTPTVRGRDFSRADTADASPVAIVNESLARALWPDQDPLGKRFTIAELGDGRAREVIGVVRDIPVRTERLGFEPVVYASYLQQPADRAESRRNMFRQMTFLLRHRSDPMSLLPGARAASADVEPDMPLGSIATLDQYVGGGVRMRWFYAVALGTFALAAAALAAIGVYGITAYAVAQRTREIAIRMTVGAAPRDIVNLVARRTAWPIAIGIAGGVAASLGLTRLVAAQLWGVAATDPATFAIASLALLAVAILACAIPARRAIRIEPSVAMKCE